MKHSPMRSIYGRQSVETAWEKKRKDTAAHPIKVEEVADRMLCSLGIGGVGTHDQEGYSGTISIPLI
jgi:hypothetical protein